MASPREKHLLQEIVPGSDPVANALVPAVEAEDTVVVAGAPAVEAAESEATVEVLVVEAVVSVVAVEAGATGWKSALASGLARCGLSM